MTIVINRAYLPIKAHYFLFFAALGPILPQLNVFGRQLGVSPGVMGMVTGVLPLLWAAAKPSFGLLVDYFTNQRKLIFMSLIALMTVSHCCLWFLPTPTRTTEPVLEHVRLNSTVAVKPITTTNVDLLKFNCHWNVGDDFELWLSTDKYISTLYVDKSTSTCEDLNMVLFSTDPFLVCEPKNGSYLVCKEDKLDIDNELIKELIKTQIDDDSNNKVAQSRNLTNGIVDAVTPSQNLINIIEDSQNTKDNDINSNKSNDIEHNTHIDNSPNLINVVDGTLSTNLNNDNNNSQKDEFSNLIAKTNERQSQNVEEVNIKDVNSTYKPSDTRNFSKIDTTNESKLTENYIDNTKGTDNVNGPTEIKVEDESKNISNLKSDKAKPSDKSIASETADGFLEKSNNKVQSVDENHSTNSVDEDRLYKIVNGEIKNVTTNEERSFYASSTFWFYVVFMCVGAVSFNVANCIADAVCFNVLGPENGNKYGHQRTWGTAGYGITALLGGWLIDKASGGDGDIKNFTPAFILAIIFTVFDIVACRSLKLPKLSSPSDSGKALKTILKMPRVLIFITFAMIIGIFDSFIIYYMFWYLEELAEITGHMPSIKLIEGAIVAAQSFGELFFFFYSGRILKRWGHGMTMTFCLFCYGVRLALISFISHPWHFVFVEILMQGPTYALCYATIVGYAAEVAPEGYSATVQGIVAGMDDGIGFSLGSLLGGFLYSYLGGTNSFRLMSLIGLLASFIHALLFKIIGHKPVTDISLEDKLNAPEVERMLQENNDSIYKDTVMPIK